MIFQNTFKLVMVPNKLDYLHCIYSLNMSSCSGLFKKLSAILCYLLKSHFSICQESFVKKPAEENIQTVKIQRQKEINQNI